ncbi:hypothetical protein [Pseudomonas brassicacearum]|uniref:Uncharacterized protein n=1 Tax=Pseudomonas brassicacearum TaxID=930166 RepID=A0A423GN83_9PSED|nr:hypothetical protein [Pseudomonas brassicacearum]ROM93790.1 hypothetical protein BK658_19185 [Pseudomonas brassicacearum]
MPITIQFYSGPKEFSSLKNPLSIGTVINWLTQSGYPLDLFRGDGLMLSDFLGRTTKTYGFLQPDDFLKDLKTFVNNGSGPTGARSSNLRTTPESTGVFLAPPQTDVKKHAAHRMERQLRLFSIIALLKCNNLFSSATQGDVDIPTTLYQHGQGGVGDAAAHKIMATFTVSSKRLEDLVSDRASKTFLIYLQSETSILKSCFNNADSEIETLIRIPLRTIARTIITDDRLTPSLTRSEFNIYVHELWDKLHSEYIDACKTAIFTSSGRMTEQKSHYDHRKHSQTIPTAQVFDAKKKSAEAALTTIVLDVYLDFAVSTVSCPLSEAETDNLYDTFFQH